MTEIPNGLVGKAYVFSAFVGAIAIIVGAIVAIIVLPFWIVATVAVVLAFLGLGFIVIFGRARE